MASAKFAATGIASLFCATAVLVLLSPELLSRANAQNTQILYSACNSNKIPSGSPLWSAVGSVLGDLEENTADNGYSYKTQKSEGGSSAYGEAQCDGSLSKDQCTNCLTQIGDNIWSICGGTIGARVQFVDCYLRYENYQF